MGGQAFSLARAGARVTGIDISPQAVLLARQAADQQGLTSIRFEEMDAHSLALPSHSFDRVCGSGILHHLDVAQSLVEISRVLRPGGSAIFFEPLGHNPAINWYRRRTPDLRTPNEHPLVMSDIELMRQRFEQVDVSFFHLTALLAVPLRHLRSFDWWVNLASRIDDSLFRIVPAARCFAWIVVISLSDPKRAAVS